jgi:hypothetical protein
MLKRAAGSITLLTALIVSSSPFAYAQGVTTSLSGVVVDTSSAVIPGADVVAKSNSTTAESRTVSAENGTFTIPALNPGTYTVTVSLSGFKTAVLNDVILNAGTPGSVRVILAVGGLEETVVVQAASEIIQTQSPAVSTTVDANRIINLPLTSRSAMDFVVMLPGVQSSTDNRNSMINGLPQSAINITWDGVNVQDNNLKTTDGFFAIIDPRLDAIEEVTLTGAAQGAEATGQGAARINFVTRSGSNTYTGSAYHYFRNDALNSNTWVRNRDGLPKANLLRNQPGTRIGGPIQIPGVFDGHNKAFFFVNYEEFRQPGEFTVTNRSILHPASQQGVFRYSTANGIQEVNLLQLAAANGQLATIDPTIAKLLSDIRASTVGTGTITPTTNPSRENFSFPGTATNFNYYPTVRIDYNVTDKHRVTGTVNYQNFENFPDQTNNLEVRFPGFPNTAGQTSWRMSNSVALRSTLTKNLVNEARVATVNYEVDFSSGVSASQFKGTSIGDQNGYNLGTNLGTTAFTVTGATSQANSSGRQSPLVEYLDTLNWIKGSHSISMGGSWTTAKLYSWSQTLAPGITFGVDSTEPANNMFTTTNFPNASSANLDDARTLYALLTGRVASVTGNAVLNANGEYEFNGNRIQRGRINEMGVFMQDAWRVRPGLTLNAGLRWQLQLPFTPDANNYTTASYADVFGVSGLDANGNPNVFKPGVMTGRETQFIQYAKGTKAYRIDYKNFAPSIGGAWTPSVASGWLQRVLGAEGDSVIRAGYAKAFTRNGMSDYSGRFGANPGSQITVTRSNTLGNLNNDGLGLPVLLRQPNRLGPASFSTTPDYPLSVAKGTAQVTNSVNIFDPNMKTPSTHSWNIGWQRALTRNMAFEVRYVGTRGNDLWGNINYNEVNLDNGFLDEFRLAQANLQANIAAGRGNTFRYFGPGTGTAPLPIYLAYFSGVPTSDAGDASRYTSTLFANTNFVNPLARFNPNPYAPASSNANTGLYGTPDRRANALAAGLPANFFIANPGMLGGAIVRSNTGRSHYDALQLELRRRLSQGLQTQLSYAYGDTYATTFYSIRRPILDQIDVGSEGSVRHAFKLDFVYELPFGRGKRFAANMGSVMERIAGGWSIAGTGRFQSGEAVDFGNVRLVGMTEDDLRKMYGLYEYPQVFTTNAPMRFYRLPQDIIENTTRAGDVSATSATGYGAQGPPTGRYLAPANGPDCIETAMSDTTNRLTGIGDCGTRSLVIVGPGIRFADFSVVKRVPISGKINFEFRAEALNVFNHPTVTGGTTGTVTPSSSRTVQLVSRLNW